MSLREGLAFSLGNVGFSKVALGELIEPLRSEVNYNVFVSTCALEVDCGTLSTFSFFPDHEMNGFALPCSQALSSKQ